MQINFHQKHLHLSDNQKDYVSAKLESLTRYKAMLDESVWAKVDVEYSEHVSSDAKIHMSVTVHVPGADLRAETACLTVEEGIDLIEPKLAQQLEKHKAA